VLLTNPAYRLADADVEMFRTADELKKIECHDTDLTEAGFKAIAALPQAARFERLQLPAAKAAAGVDALAKCRDLEWLDLRGTPLKGQMSFIAKLTRLRTFAAEECGLTDDDLVHFRNARLVQFHISNNPKVTAAGLEHLAASADDLTTLNLTGTGVTGAAAARVATFRPLTNLRLPRAAGRTPMSPRSPPSPS